MADKTSTADLSVRASFAVAQGVLIAMSLPLFYAVMPESVRTMLPLYLFLIIPILSFGTSIFMNWFLQYMYCQTVSVGTISIGALMSPGLVLLLSFLSYFLPFLRSPISQLFSESPKGSSSMPGAGQGSPSMAGAGQGSPEEATFARELWGYCFYLFWGGLYGQTVASGMASACA